MPSARDTTSQPPQDEEHSSTGASRYPLSLSEYKRYGRQMILPGFGLEAQLRLRAARVLVVGAGGLGCPVIQQLASAGVGHITAIDHDTVEMSNLARQFLHTEQRIGMPKAESVRIACQGINPHITVEPLVEPLTPSNALALAQTHDLILDCTDNPATRYTLSDAAVLADKMLVSGAAQGMEGQLAVWNRYLDPAEHVVPPVRYEETPHGARRQSLPPAEPVADAPRADDVQDCSETGVVGSITALVGAAQAAEAIRLLARIGDEFLFGPAPGLKGQPHAGSLTLFSPFSSPFSPYRSIRLRPRRVQTCISCGDPQLVRAGQAEKGDVEGPIEDLDQVDYVAFCGTKCGPYPNRSGLARLEPRDAHGSPGSLSGAPTVYVDVRPPDEFGIVSLPRSLNIPMTQVRRSPRDVLEKMRSMFPPHTEAGEVRLLCRRGNDSLEAAHTLTESQTDSDAAARPRLTFIDVRGGLQAYAREVDTEFPVY